jgi:hypothetical protein
MIIGYCRCETAEYKLPHNSDRIKLSPAFFFKHLRGT